MTKENVVPMPKLEQEANSPANPFANLDALRNPQDYEEFMRGKGGDGVRRAHAQGGDVSARAAGQRVLAD